MDQSESTVQIITRIKKDPNIEAFTNSISSTEVISAIKANFWPNDYHLNANISQKRLSVGKKPPAVAGRLQGGCHDTHTLPLMLSLNED